MSRQYKYNSVQCIHCGADNPLTAYCCLSCFKIIKTQPKFSIWKTRIQPTVPALAIVLTVFIALVILLKHWMQGIDAQVTMNLKSVDYSLSFMADKRKKQAQLDAESVKPNTGQSLSSVADGVVETPAP